MSQYELGYRDGGNDVRADWWAACDEAGIPRETTFAAAAEAVAGVTLTGEEIHVAINALHFERLSLRRPEDIQANLKLVTRLEKVEKEN